MHIFGYLNKLATLEPLSKDTLNKGHNTFNLSIKDKFCGPYRTIGNTILPLKEDNLCIIVKLHQFPKCPLFRSSTVYRYMTVLWN